jgi:hypothetical protein
MIITNKKMDFEELDEFKKDLKKLLKRFLTLEDDLSVIKKVLIVHPDPRPPFSFQVDGLGISSCVIKVKKMACRALKGRGADSGLRLVYAYFKNPPKIVLVELYFKADKEIEDRDRILKHFV